MQESVELFSRSGVRKNVSDKAVAAVIHKLATTFLGVCYSSPALYVCVCVYITPQYVSVLEALDLSMYVCTYEGDQCYIFCIYIVYMCVGILGGWQ